MSWRVAGLMAAALGLIFWAERGKPMQASTRKMLRMSGLKRALTLQTLHDYVYARWPLPYVRLGRRVMRYLGPWGRTWLANHYHSKVLTPELARAIITIDQEIPLRDLEQIIPYPKARDIVLSMPLDIAVCECSCRISSPHPCQPTQVCMIVGQPIVDFTLEHHPDKTRRITQEEALELLREEHDRGHVHTAWFKESTTGRFYAICNCCKCCCGGMEAMMKNGIPLMASSGYVVRVERSRCVECGACVERCPFGALSLNGKGLHVDWGRCMGCGVCERRCAAGALTLVSDARKGIPLDVRVLANEARQDEARELAIGG